jgi:prophage DNA circulation protein
MAADRTAILTWLSDLTATLVTDSIDLDDLSDRITAASALDADAFSGEVLDLTRIAAESVTGMADFARFVAPSGLDDATANAFAVLVAVGLAVSGPRIDWPSRPAARDARSAIGAAAEAAMAVASSLGANGADLYAWLGGLAAVSIRIISDIAANAVPMVKVETGISLPSTVLAYMLYSDAQRAGSLVDVAGSLTPMLVPSGFEALES